MRPAIKWNRHSVAAVTCRFGLWVIVLVLNAWRLQVTEAGDSVKLVPDTGGHTAAVRAVAFTPDGNQLISVSHDKTIRVWDIVQGVAMRTLRIPTGEGASGELFAAALSEDGRRLAVGGYDSSLYIIDLNEGKLDRRIEGNKGSVLGLAFSPNGILLASANADATASVWDVSTGKNMHTIRGHTAPLRCVAFSPTGKQLATASDDGTAQIWSIEGVAQPLAVLAGHGKTISQIAWSPSGEVLATASDDGTLRLWNSAGKELKRFDNLGKIVNTVVFSPNSKEVLFTWRDFMGKGGAGLINYETGNVRVRFSKNHNYLMCGTISRDGHLAATAGFNPEDVRVWRTQTAEQLFQFQGRGDTKWSVGWSADGNAVAWGNIPYLDRPMQLNDMGPLQTAFDLTKLDFVPLDDGYIKGPTTLGDLVIEKSGDSVLTAKRVGQVVSQLDLKPLGRLLRSAAWFDDQRILVGFNAEAVALIDSRTGTLARRYVGHTGTVWGISVSPDNRYFATASHDQTLKLWRTNHGRPVLSFHMAEPDWIAWTEDGYYAASPNGEKLIGWQVENGPDRLALFYPASKFRKTFYRPDVIRRLIDAGSLEKALADTDDAAGRQGRRTEVAQVLPPKVAITLPVPPRIRIEGKAIVIEAVAQSVGTNPVTELRLFLDDRPLPGTVKAFESPALGEVRGRWTVEVPPGSHPITVQASSAVSKGLSEPLDIVGGGDDSKATGKLYLLVIGINDYLYLGKRNNLDSAVPDARSIHRSFQDLSRPLFRSVESRLLLDKQATRANILDALQWLKQSARPGDKAIVFYAGHGDNQATGQFYILPVDTKLDDLRGTGISDDELKRSIGDLPCTTVLMLDACYSGGFGEKKRKTRGLSKPTDALAGDMINDYGLATLCGARDNQTAIEEGGHGFFTLALTQGLAGEADTDKDGLVELYELLPFVCSRVRKLSAGDQVPTFGLPQSIESFPMSRP